MERIYRNDCFYQAPTQREFLGAEKLYERRD